MAIKGASRIGQSTPVRTSTKTRLRRLLGVVFLADAVVLAAAVLLAWSLRLELPVWDNQVGAQEELWRTGGPLILVVWMGWLAARGAYSTRFFGSGPEEFKTVFLSSMLTAGSVGMTCYLLKYDLSRGFVVLTFLLGIPLLLLERYAVRRVLHRMRINGKMLRRVIAVGSPDAVAELVEILHRERYVGYEIIGSCIPTHLQDDTALAVPVLGTPETARAVCAQSQADTVLVAGGAFSSSIGLRQIGWQLEGSDIDLVVVPSLADVAGPRIHLRPVAGLPLMLVEPPQADEAGRWSKRLFDVVGSAAALALLSPLMLAVAVAVKLQDGGPVFFRQSRVGRSGTRFDCWKFRSMVVDAERRLDEVRHLNESDGAMFKVRRDPRITRVGRLIRRYSLDELPQLFNVLRGTMSLVGPRPPLPAEVQTYSEDVRRRLLVRPGLTGLWQVSGRCELSWRETVRLDLYYVDNWSMMGDLVILGKTIRAVLRSEGAA